MILSITATLTEEEIIILAKEKWRQETISTGDFDENQNIIQTELPNPLTASDFIVSMYQAIIVNDIAKIFVAKQTEELKEQILLTTTTINDTVSSTVTATMI